MSKKGICSRLVLFFLVGWMLTGCSPKTEDTFGVSDIVRAVTPEPFPDEVTYPVFFDRTFDEENHTLSLANDENNAVSLRFTLTEEDGTELFVSDPVPAGESILWDAAEHWTEGGTHSLTILTTPIDEKGREGDSVKQTISVNLT